LESAVANEKGRRLRLQNKKEKKKKAAGKKEKVADRPQAIANIFSRAREEGVNTAARGSPGGEDANKDYTESDRLGKQTIEHSR